MLESKEHIEVVGESASIEHGLQQVVESGPHVLLLGVRGNEAGSLDHLPRLHRARPDVAVLVLSRALDQSTARSLASRPDVRGHLSKDVTVEELLEAIETAAAGEYVDGSHHEHEPAPVKIPDQHGPISRLTRQELRILSLIAAGMSNQQIAAELFLVEKTVRNHVTRILAKLGVQRRTQAALLAVRSGLIHH